MSIHISCQCGESYDLKDEYAGRTLKCSKCGASLQVVSEQGIRENNHSSDSAFSTI